MGLLHGTAPPWQAIARTYPLRISLPSPQPACRLATIGRLAPPLEQVPQITWYGGTVHLLGSGSSSRRVAKLPDSLARQFLPHIVERVLYRTFDMRNPIAIPLKLQLLKISRTEYRTIEERQRAAQAEKEAEKDKAVTTRSTWGDTDSMLSLW